MCIRDSWYSEGSALDNIPVVRNPEKWEQLAEIDVPILTFSGGDEEDIYHHMDLIKEKDVYKRQRLIDTANAYVNEKAVGRAIRKSGIARNEIFLETKLWPSFYEQADAVEKTLERLDTDYIDLLLIHQPAGNYIAGYRLMEKAYKDGKVRAIGLSNFTIAQIQEILAVCEVKPAILQTEVHPYYQEPELKQFLAQENMVIQAWYPLGHEMCIRDSLKGEKA